MCVQSFQVAEPQWVKYVQLRFLSHYGAEPVCALNDVRILGKSAADDLEDRLAMEHAQEHAAQAESRQPQAAEPLSLPSSPPALPLVPDSAAQPAQNATLVLPSPTEPLQEGPTQPEMPPGQTGAASGPSSASAQVPQQPQQPQQQQQQQQQQQPMQQPSSPQPSAAPQTPPPGPVVLPPSSQPASADGSQPVPSSLVLSTPDLVPAQLPPEINRLPDLLPGSSKPKHGGSVYDVLVGELTALKLQHKAYLRALAELDR